MVEYHVDDSHRFDSRLQFPYRSVSPSKIKAICCLCDFVKEKIVFALTIDYLELKVELF